MSLWVLFTVAAAAVQTLRFVLQKRLAVRTLSTAGATFARFLFAAPVAAVLTAVGLGVSDIPVPLPDADFWAPIFVGGVAQIVATDLTVRLFAMRNFAVGVAFTKTEAIQVALISTLVLGESLGTLAWGAIILGLAGVILMSRSPEPGAPLFGRAAIAGIIAGGLFGIAAICYRAATQALEPAPYGLRAVAALAGATAVQTVVMALWLAWREPGEVRRVLSGWRQTAPVGLAGLLGSLGWFAAFSLQSAAYVRALGQVEMAFTVLASVFLFREKLRMREAAGLVIVGIAAAALALAAS